MKKYIQSILSLTLGMVLAGCQQELVNPGGDAGFAGVPSGEMPFCLGTEDLGAEPLSKGTVSGAEYTPVATLKLLCFDKSGYFLGVRDAYPTPDSGSEPATGTFSGYVPESTARIHFAANVPLDLSAFPVGTSERVILSSKALSCRYDDIDRSDPSSPKLNYWGYHKEASAGAMKTWLQASTPNTVPLLRDRARVKLTVSNTLYNGGWQNNSAGTGKKVTSIRWALNNGRERGYLAPYFSPYLSGATTPWEGYESGSVTLNEYKECRRFTVLESELDAFDPSGSNYQYAFDDSNLKTSSENGRVIIVLEVNYEDNAGGNAGRKYLLAQLREGSGSDQGAMVQIIRNRTYSVNITNLAHDGYATLDQAVDPKADDFTNAPADVDVTVPFITDGTHILNLLSPKPVVVTRTAGQVYTVEFEYTKAAAESAPTVDDFKIFWEENINSGWTSETDGVVGSDLTVAATGVANTYRGTFTVKIGTIGTSYTYTDQLLILHKQSGLFRIIHFYAVEKFLYRMEPVLEQVMVGPDPYLGPSGDDTARPVFRLRFQLSQSIQEDLFPITVRLTSSTLEPYGDKYTSHTARLSGGFGLLNSSTAESADGTPLASSNTETDWNYRSSSWNYWYGYTLTEYPKTGDVWDGEVVIYLKDIRDAYAQASNQGVGLYLDVENFEPKALFLTANQIGYPSYPYSEGAVAGEYKVGPAANRYRATITGATPNATYTLSEETPADWLDQTPASVTADASGNLDFRFTVAANITGERSANIVFTNGSYSTKVKITQASGMDSGLRLKAESTSVMGSTREVELTVYSDADWTLESVGGGSFSASSGASTGNMGAPVKFIMPVNYTDSDIKYTITARKGSKLATVEITQRKVKELTPGKTVSFVAGTHFLSSHYQTLSGITGTLSSISTVGGGLLDPTERWDFSSNPNTLRISKDDSVMEITGVGFAFHHALLTTYCPDHIDVTAVTPAATPASAYYYGSDTQNWEWRPEAPVTGVESITFDLHKGTAHNIGFIGFVVEYTGATWE